MNHGSAACKVHRSIESFNSHMVCLSIRFDIVSVLAAGLSGRSFNFDRFLIEN